MYSLNGRRVYVSGDRGMIGGAIIRRLRTEGCELLTVGRDRVDLRDQAAARRWLREAKPDAMIIAAARVGGILANASRPADFLFDNLMIAVNLIEGAHEVGVGKLLFLGSSCIYPKFAPQPITEEALLTGPLEDTNEAYAIAKIAGIKLCEAYRKQHGADFISAMPTNAYGPGDNYDAATSHVLPALLRKAHLVKTGKAPHLEIWGTGEVRREFAHADDIADACVFLMQHYSGEAPVNVGSGEDLTITELAELICRVVGIEPVFRYDRSKPDGTPQKLMSPAKLRGLGWRPRIALEDGVRSVYRGLVDSGQLDG
jgi:GDP-L-fucose synthase